MIPGSLMWTLTEPGYPRGLFEVELYVVAAAAVGKKQKKNAAIEIGFWS